MIEITPKGIYENGKKVRRSNYLSVLREYCKIKKGTTLQDIFLLVEGSKSLKYFISKYSGCPQIEEFHSQAKEPMRSEEPDEEKLDKLEIYWRAETFSYEEKIKHPGGLRERIKSIDFNVFPEFHGIGPAIDIDKKRGKDKTNFSISYSPMYDLADLPVELNENFEIYEPKKLTGSRQIILKSDRQFTLLEVLDAIYFDISFIGGPSENRDFLEKIRNINLDKDFLEAVHDISEEVDKDFQKPEDE